MAIWALSGVFEPAKVIRLGLLMELTALARVTAGPRVVPVTPMVDVQDAPAKVREPVREKEPSVLGVEAWVTVSVPVPAWAALAGMLVTGVSGPVNVPVTGGYWMAARGEEAKVQVGPVMVAVPAAMPWRWALRLTWMAIVEPATAECRFRTWAVGRVSSMDPVKLNTCPTAPQALPGAISVNRSVPVTLAPLLTKAPTSTILFAVVGVVLVELNCQFPERSSGVVAGKRVFARPQPLSEKRERRRRHRSSRPIMYPMLDHSRSVVGAPPGRKSPKVFKTLHLSLDFNMQSIEGKGPG